MDKKSDLVNKIIENITERLNEIKKNRRKKRGNKKRVVRNTNIDPISEEQYEREKKEWDNLLSYDVKQNRTLEDEMYSLSNEWNPGNYHIKPARHHADHYDINMLTRTMKNAKLMSCAICPHFYPTYKSTVNTRVYNDIDRKKKMWLRLEDNSWINISYKDAIKNLIFHSCSVYTDAIRRLKDQISEETLRKWDDEKLDLLNFRSDTYELICKNLFRGIPKLSIHPYDEELILVEKYFDDTKYINCIEREIKNHVKNLHKLPISEQTDLFVGKILHDERFKFKMKTAKKHHAKMRRIFEGE